MTNKSLIVTIGILIFALAAFILLNLEDPGVVQEDPVEKAEEWIKENSGTFAERNGSDLQFVETEEVEEGVHEITFSFESSFAGYGDVEEDEMNAQVITPHEIIVTVEDNKVTKAVTDGTYDEINKITLTLEEYLGEIVSVYFALENEELVALERLVEGGDEKEKQAVLALLDGLKEDEKEAGYVTSISEGVELNDFYIEEQVAYADFNENLDASGSATVTMIREQIERTLLQFESISSVVISINGNVEEVLQP
jgi:spore germination protein GerM